MNFDPSKIPESAWIFEAVSDDGLTATDIAWIDKEAGTYVRRKRNLMEGELLDRNKEALNDSYGKRFGDGVVAARIPLNVFFNTIAPRLKEGDTDYAKWFLNRDEGNPYRTFRGKV